MSLCSSTRSDGGEAAREECGLSLTLYTTLRLWPVLTGSPSYAEVLTEWLQGIVHSYRDGLLLGRELCAAQDKADTNIAQTHTWAEDARDLAWLGQHVMLPLDVVRQQQMWLLVNEDVRRTLADRLSHRHTISCTDMVHNAETREEEGMTGSALAQLWQALWSTLGAAWRQRRRLAGKAACLSVDLYTNAQHGLWPVACPGSDAARTTMKGHRTAHEADMVLPFPPVHASYVEQAQYSQLCQRCKHLIEEEEDGEEQGSDALGFGPLTPERIGITAEGHYVLRAPLTSLLRGISLAASSHTAPAAEGEEDKMGSHSGVRALPLMDSDDAVPASLHALSALVPYLSPACYEYMGTHTTTTTTSTSNDASHVLPLCGHGFADDAWSVAVVVLEAALSGFEVCGPACHLAHDTTQGSSSNNSNSSSSSSSVRSEPPVFAATMRLLVEQHRIAPRAAGNFIYAALYYLSRCITPPQPTSSDSCDGVSASPCPRRLAEEWYAYLTGRYGLQAVQQGVLYEVATCGLCWSHKMRWQRFLTAHCITHNKDNNSINNNKDGGGEDEAQAAHSVAREQSEAAACKARVLHSTSAQARDDLLASLRAPYLLQVNAEKEKNNSTNGTSALHNEMSDVWRVWTLLARWLREHTRRAIATHGTLSSPDIRQGCRFAALMQLVQYDLSVCVEGQSNIESATGTAKERTYNVLRQSLLYDMICRSQLPSLAALQDNQGTAHFLSLHTVRAFLALQQQQQQQAEEQQAIRGNAIGYKDILQVWLSDAALSNHHTTNDNSNTPANSSSSSSSNATREGTRSGMSLREQLLQLMPSAEAALHRGETSCPGSTPDVTGLMSAMERHVQRLRTLLLLPTTLDSKEPLRQRAVHRYLLHEMQRTRDVFVPVPATLRGEVWAALLGCPSLHDCELHYMHMQQQQQHGTHRCDDDESVWLLPARWERQLALDLPRCHACHPLLSSEEGYRRLRRLIRSWAHAHVTNKEGDDEEDDDGNVQAYWQGMDSIAAVVLSVSGESEPLAAMLLSRIIECFVAHEAEDEEQQQQQRQGAKSTQSVTSGRRSENKCDAAVRSTHTCPPPCARKEMHACLRQLRLALAYFDPTLARRLFDEMHCTADMFAMSWFVTLFAHLLPMAQVYLVWDFLFLHSVTWPNVFVCLCGAVLHQRRDVLLSADSASSLTMLGSTASIDVKAALEHAAYLLRSLPPDIGSLAHASFTHCDTTRSDEQRTTSRGAAPCVRAVAAMEATTLAEALVRAQQQRRRRQQRRAPYNSWPDMKSERGCNDNKAATRSSSPPSSPDWTDAGLYLIDLRPVAMPGATSVHAMPCERIVGALRVPLTLSKTAEEEVEEEGGEGSDSAAAAVHTMNGTESTRDEPDIQLQRRIEVAATALQRQLGHTAMAALAPLSALCAEDSEIIVSNTQQDAPHVVLIPGNVKEEEEDVGSAEAQRLVRELAEPLGLELIRAGVPHVSLLRGGFAALKRVLPQLVVETTV